MTTEERLETLEKELARAKRRSRRLLAAVGLVAGAVALVWVVVGAGCNTQGGKVPTVIRAGRFQLVDENGSDRAVLTVDKDGPSLTLLDENGNDRALLYMFREDEPGLLLLDENGKTRARLHVDKDVPGLDLLDENGQPCAGLYVDEDVPALALADENGNDRAVLTVDKDGPSLTLLDENGEAIWQAP